VASDNDPETFVRFRAKAYVWDLESASAAYVAHNGPKAFVRYEDLRRDTHGAMTGLCYSLGLAPSESELARAIDARAWGRIPERKKGAGKFHRKATPGAWRQDLSEDAQRAVETIASPVLDAFYPGWGDGDDPARPPAPEAMARRWGPVRPVFPPGSRRVLHELVALLYPGPGGSPPRETS
jgi:hypothetical protein